MPYIEGVMIQRQIMTPVGFLSIFCCLLAFSAAVNEFAITSLYLKSVGAECKYNFGLLKFS